MWFAISVLVFSCSLYRELSPKNKCRVKNTGHSGRDYRAEWSNLLAFLPGQDILFWLHSKMFVSSVTWYIVSCLGKEFRFKNRTQLSVVMLLLLLFWGWGGGNKLPGEMAEVAQAKAAQGVDTPVVTLEAAVLPNLRLQLSGGCLMGLAELLSAPVGRDIFRGQHVPAIYLSL